MAAIILPPNYSSEDQIVEFSNQSFGELMTTDLLFSYSIPISEEFVSFELSVTPDSTPFGITIDNGRYSGHYQDYFESKGIPLMLTLRDRTTLAIYQVNGFNNLPHDATSADCIEFSPPPPQTQVFTITATLKFKKKAPPAITETITKSVTQTLYGSATAWAGKLRDYIIASGPFPRIV